MIWEYLHDGEYINPFFGTWYSPSGLVGYGILLGLSVVLFLFMFSILVKRSAVQNSGSRPANANPRQTPNVQTSSKGRVALHFMVLRKLIERTYGQHLGFLGGLCIFAIVVSAAYLVAMYLIVNNPNVLLTHGTFQQLSIDEFRQAVNFLYRFGGAGIILIFLTFLTSLGAVASLIGFKET